MKTLNNKLNRIALVAILFAAVISTVSCDKEKGIDPDPTIPGDDVTNADINKWVLDSMRYYYYWSDRIPASPNVTADPETFFESILSRPDDRFSWIQNNEDLRNQLSGVIKTSGLGITWFRIGDTNAGAAVRFVHKGSPADKAGIKRGDMFIRVNGQPFTLSGNSVTNADPLFGNDTFTITHGQLNGNVISPGSDVTLTPVEGFQETAILLDTVITTPNNTKVAYLFYNRFLGGQAQELVDAFTKFKAAGVTELIIDERYNGGGSISVAGLLSALIHKNFNVNDPYIQYNYNKNFSNSMLTYGQIFGAANGPLVTSRNLGLDRVYILATGSSASASELLINNLKPFMPGQVIHIGSTTRGKDDASITLSNSSSKFQGQNDWGIQPIILKYVNRNGEGNFVNGLVPTHSATENIPFAPMGSANDPLIGKALTLIDPSYQAVYGRQMSVQKSRAAQLQIEELVEFNRNLVEPIPLDVTETLKGGRINPFHIK